MSYPYRCTRRTCRKRVTLKKHKEAYQRPKYCHECKGNIKFDRWQKAERKKSKCLCDGYHFPHRKGSLWCREYKGKLTDKLLAERWRAYG